MLQSYRFENFDSKQFVYVIHGKKLMYPNITFIIVFRWNTLHGLINFVNSIHCEFVNLTGMWALGTVSFYWANPTSLISICAFHKYCYMFCFFNGEPSLNPTGVRNTVKPWFTGSFGGNELGPVNQEARYIGVNFTLIYT